MREPIPSDFGLSPEQVVRFRQVNWTRRFGGTAVLLVGILILIRFASDPSTPNPLINTVFFLAVLSPFAYFAGGALVEGLYGRLDPAYKSVRQFSKSLQAHALWLKQQHLAFWQTLSGGAFENALGDVLQRNGYSVTVTPASGDQGIDILAAKAAQRLCIQCKQHKRPVGPAAVRDLLGACIGYPDTTAVLASTRGFTRGARELAHRNHVVLWDINDILSLSAGRPE
jgi:hypothetical protein